MLISGIKTEILTVVEAACQNRFGQKPEALKLGYPPQVELGDFTVECFPLAKQFRQNPAQIAQAIAAEIEPSESIQSVRAVGPYLNVKVYNRALFGGVCDEIVRQRESLGNSNMGQGQRVMVEYLSPNTNKPLHLGHIRNGVLGMGVSKLLEATGHTVIKANLVNDRGVHICKSMLAWLKWGDGGTPETTGTKGDHFVGDWYVRYAQEEKNHPDLEPETQAMLRKWESGDPETLKLWEMMNGWVYNGFAETYQKLGLEFDAFYYESHTYNLGKDLIQTGLEKGAFVEAEDGAIIAKLPVDEFGTQRDGSQKVETLLRVGTAPVFTSHRIWERQR